MVRMAELRLLRQLLEARMRGLRICNEVLEHRAPDEIRELMEDMRSEDARLISLLQRAIQSVMEGF